MKTHNFILRDRYNLTADKSSKKTKHIVLELEDKIDFSPGDSVGIYPTNDYDLLKSLFSLLKDIPKDFNTQEIQGRDLESLNKNIINIVYNKQRDEYKSLILKDLLEGNKREHLEKFMRDYTILDFLIQNPVDLTFEELIKNTVPIFPRLYSIASSAKKSPRYLDLAVNIVEYEALSGKRMGICSRFFSNLPINSEIKGYVQANPAFRLPSIEKDIIMVSTGTGIAPFRAFMQEREIESASGRNWLLFGERTSDNDFYYREELDNWKRKSFLKLDTAFSRDQKDKIYIQHIMKEKSKEIFKWIENGAYIYVCGSRDLGKNIDNTIYDILKCNLYNDDHKADEYIKKLRREKRYLKDVY